MAKSRKMKSKKELEKEGRTLGIELDRRHSKEDLIEELEAVEVGFTHTHDDGTTHSHVDGDKKHTHESKKLKKEEFLISKGLHERPNSHLAIKAYEEYCETSKSGIR